MISVEVPIYWKPRSEYLHIKDTFPRAFLFTLKKMYGKEKCKNGNDKSASGGY